MRLMKQPLWIRIFVAIGILATIGVIVTLFFAFGRRPNRMWATETPPVTSPDFLAAVAGGVASAVHEGGEARWLRNGDQFYPAMLADMRGAQKSLHFTVYIWEKGRISDEITRIFIERARAGVAVRVLFDSFGSAKMPKDDIEEMKKAGVKVQMFREASFGRFTRYHRRTHRRAIVIDGEIGYTGGAAVADKWMGDARNDEEWRDDMVRVTGPMARSLQAAFAELWTGSNGEILAGSEVYPPPSADGGVATDPSVGTLTHEKLSSPPVLHVGLASSPTSDKHPLRLFFALSFLAARERLYIASPYFVPDKHIRKFVGDQARKGVDVRLLVPNHKTDAKPIREATHSYLEELLSAGVRIYEYQPTMMHSKYVVVDGTWSVVGSANMDIRSKELNSENVLGILDPVLAREIEETFAQDLAQAKEIRLDEWKQRSAFKRLRERVAVLFVEQY